MSAARRIGDGLRFAGEAVLASYATVFFAEGRAIGALLLLATFLAPATGAVGLAGLLVALGAAVALGFERALIRNGAYLFNSLLVSLGLAYLQHAHPVAWSLFPLLLVAASVFTLFATVALGKSLYQQHGLPSLSLPFLAVAFILFFLFHSLNHGAAVPATPALLPAPAWLPAVARDFLSALGAIFFLPQPAVGAVILLALLCFSRLLVVLAAGGFAVGLLVLHGFGAANSPADLAFVNFNLVVTALALGGVFFVPARGSLALVVLSTAFCAMTALAMAACLRPYAIPPLALPFNVVVLLTLYALRARSSQTLAACAPLTTLQPERTFQAYHTNRQRFPDSQVPVLSPPFYGERVVTQGFDGALTHKGPWRYALDFEILDEQGRRSTEDGRLLEHYLVFGSPVLAPADGVVARTNDAVDDNAVGETNLQHNWGNYVLLRLDSGLYALLCHLKRKSVAVYAGQRVARGALLGACGSSGHSPVPHLHLQMQATPEIGAATIPFRLGPWLERTGHAWRYRFSGVPAGDARIRTADSDARVAACFNGLAAGAARYRVTAPGGSWEETVTLRVAAGGALVFQSPATGCTLTAHRADQALLVTDFQGHGRSILQFFRLALSRVPFAGEPGIAWEDFQDLRPLLPAGARLWLDTAGPFLARYPLLRLAGRFDWRQDAFAGTRGLLCVVAETDRSPVRGWPRGQTPDKVELFLSSRDGIAGARVATSAGEVLVERV